MNYFISGVGVKRRSCLLRSLLFVFIFHLIVSALLLLRCLYKILHQIFRVAYTPPPLNNAYNMFIQLVCFCIIKIHNVSLLSICPLVLSLRSCPISAHFSWYNMTSYLVRFFKIIICLEMSLNLIIPFPCDVISRLIRSSDMIIQLSDLSVSIFIFSEHSLWSFIFS